MKVIKGTNARSVTDRKSRNNGMRKKKCLSPAKKYKVYKSSINKSIHFVQRSLSSSTRG